MLKSLLLLCPITVEAWLVPQQSVPTTSRPQSIQDSLRLRPSPPSSSSPSMRLRPLYGTDDDDDDDGGFLWDGVEIDDAHNADYDDDFDPADAFMPSPTFMAMASAVPSPALLSSTGGVGARMGDGGAAAAFFDPLANAGGMYKRFAEEEEAMAAGDYVVSEEELEEMWGDPAFLGGDDTFFDIHDTAIDVDVGGDDGFVDDADDGGFLWDGEPIEGAHDDEFEPDDNDQSDAFIPSASFMAMASMAPVDFDTLANAGELHRRFAEDEAAAAAGGYMPSEADLEEIGGDPFFLGLDGDDDDDGFDGVFRGEKPAESVDMGGSGARAIFDSVVDNGKPLWDGNVKEDAHLDSFY